MTERAILKTVALADLIVRGAVRWTAIIALAALIVGVIIRKRSV